MTDVHVRPAITDDAGDIARIQLSTWRTAYAATIPARVLDRFTIAGFTARWKDAITSPPTAAHHIVVAFEQLWPVGFAVLAPPDADDCAALPGESTGVDPGTVVSVGPLLVEPRWGRRGHGSRLLAAVADLARADGAHTAICWVLERDVASRRFLTSAGWERDGAVRELDMDGATVREVRLHTDFAGDVATVDSATSSTSSAD